MLKPGAQFAGYEIIRVLGRGRSSVCYEATHTLLLRTVALKVIDADLSGQEAFRRDFRRAKLQQATLEHPHLVATFEEGLHDGQLFVAMELVDGWTLEDLLIAGELEDRQLLVALGQVAGALDAIHAHGMVHCDVTPRSIFMTTEGHCVLGDFGLPGGLATTFDSGAANPYMAPEGRDGSAAAAAADVYALGAVLYDGLTAAFVEPYGSPEMDAERARRPRTRLTERRPDLPRSLDAPVAAALAQPPHAMQRSAGELMRDVQFALSDLEPVPSGLTGAKASTRALPQRNADRPGVGRALLVQTSEQSAHARAPGVRMRAGVTATALAAALGLLAGFELEGRSSDGPPPAVSAAAARSGALSVSYPGSWIRAAAPRIPGLRLADPVALQTDAALGVRYVIGTAENAHGVKLLPGALRDRVVGHLRGQAVGLAGDIQATRYQGVRVAGFNAPLTLYAISIAGGAVIAACHPAAARARSVPGACDRASAAIYVRGVRMFELGPDADYGARLRGVVTALDAAGRRLRGRLRDARTRAGQASVAAELSRAYERAARGLDGAVVSGRDEPAHLGIVAAFEETGSGYHALARAARTASTRRYASARRALRSAAARTRAAVAALGRLGYTP